MRDKIIAIIPAYNEGKHIAEVIKKTKKYVDEVIVVDDGSIDNTSEEARSADVVLRHIVNMGKGTTLKTGFEAAIKKKTDIIVTIDADGQHHPEEIALLLDKMRKEQSDIVVGIRKMNKQMPALFKFGNWFLNKVFQVLFHEYISDTQSGFRVFKANVYDKIKWDSTGYTVETEIIANAGKHNLKCSQVPITTHYVDKYKGTTILDGINIFLQMLIWKIRRS